MQLAAAQVVEALAARVAPMPSLASPLQTTREDGVTPVDLPAAWLWGDDESAELASTEGIHQVQLDGVLRLIVADAEHLDDAMNTAAAEAMALLFAAPAPYGLEWTGTRRVPATRGAVRCGEISINWRATYHVDPAAPDVLV